MKQYAVITGASSGIGRAFAKQLSRQGYALILISRREKHLQNLAAQLLVRVHRSSRRPDKSGRMQARL